MIAIHAESTEDPRTLHWAIPAETLPVVGKVVQAPGRFGELLAEGILTAVFVAPEWVATTLRAGLDWREYGDEVRRAMVRALAQPRGWLTDRADDPDAPLRAALEAVIDGDVGDYVRSHGGSIEIESAHDERVVVKLTGRCAHCPAAGGTLHDRIERELRRVHPSLRSVTAKDDGRPRRAFFTHIGHRPAV